MQTVFYILLSMKTTDGYEQFGKFFIGDNKDAAYRIFDSLLGNDDVNDDILQLDMTEMTNGLPVNIRVLNCSLEQLTENCRIITKEVFKILNLKES
jgi:hypothetical protein